MSAEPPDLRAVAERAARAAGELLRERFEAGGERATGSKSSPTDLVSEADLAAERAIRAVLGEARPQDAILGEEGGETAGAGTGGPGAHGAGGDRRDSGGADRQGGGGDGGQGGGGGLRWVVDPLDGTVNFLFGLPQWCVSVAVCDAAGGVAGVVYDPLREELFAGARDQGPPTLNGAPLRASSCQDLAHALVATGFSYGAAVRARQAQTIVALLPRVRDVRRMGSAALDLAWTAAGRYDAFYERDVKAWDTAAGGLLCAAAGLELRPLRAGGADVPAGLLAAPAAIAGALAELVA